MFGSYFPWLGFIFWVGVFSWFSTIVWTRLLRERERQQTLRSFAERGVPLDERALEKLMPGGPAWMEQRPVSAAAVSRGLMIGGIVVMFVGVGLLAGAQLVSRIEPDALWIMSTGGVIVLCVGLGLTTASIVTRRMAMSEQLPDGKDQAS